MAGGLLSMRSARRSVKFRMGQGMMCDEEVCLMGAGWCLVAGLRRACGGGRLTPPCEPLWRLLGGANVMDAARAAMR